MTLNINCARCNKKFHDMDLFLQHITDDSPCIKPQSKWIRFCIWFFSLDLTFILALGGGIFINSLIMQRICKDYSLITCALEGLSFGFLLTGLLRR